MYKGDTFAIEKHFEVDYERALMDLSDRELWIWLMYRRGYSQDYIGKSLGVTQSDVAYHIDRIQEYLRRRINEEGIH
jgi:DNA-directed RNA polymerase specialized sigma subunit